MYEDCSEKKIYWGTMRKEARLNEAQLNARIKKAEEVAMRKEAKLNARTKKAKEVTVRKEGQGQANTQRGAKIQAIRQKTTNEKAQQSYATHAQKDRRSAQLRLAVAKRTIRKYQNKASSCRQEVVECT